jgi:hypothetical protein
MKTVVGSVNTAAIDQFKKGLSITMKKVSQFILATEIASLAFGGAVSCANPTGQSIPPAVTVPAEPVKPEPNVPVPVALETPKNLRIAENILRWDAVPHASGYAVNNGTDNITTQNASFALPNAEGTYRVRALGDNTNYLDSSFTSPINHVIEKPTPTFTPVADVKFEKVSAVVVSYRTAQENIKRKVKELQAQARQLEQQYVSLPKDDPARVLSGYQEYIVERLCANSTSLIRKNISYSHFVSFFDEIPEWDGKDVFIKQIDAFQKASAHSVIRSGTELTEQKATEFETAWGTAMGNEPMPATTAEAAAMLKAILQDSVPKSAGAPGPNLIQQIEDFAEFHGWTQSLEYKLNKNDITGFWDVVLSKLTDFKITNPTDAQMAKALPRKETDEENGIVV